jgi:hypothetical protein
MANGPARHRTYFEGDDDGSVLLVLAAEGLLPADLEVVQRDHRRVNPGKEGMVKDIAALVNPVGGAGRSAVAIRDMDELSAPQVRDWFVGRMNAELPTTVPPLQLLPAAGIGTSLPVGLSRGAAATEYEISQFAMDDYILLLYDRARFGSRTGRIIFTPKGWQL